MNCVSTKVNVLNVLNLEVFSHEYSLKDELDDGEWNEECVDEFGDKENGVDDVKDEDNCGDK